MTPCPVIVFAKAPLPGVAKTRLAPVLGDDGAAALALRLLRHAVREARRAALGPVELCVWPDATDPRWPQWAEDAAVAITQQQGADLGERMRSAFERVLDSAPAALLIGSDIPALDAWLIGDAAAALADHDAVFAPAADGGYGLIGLRRAEAAVFEGLRWSHPRVMDDTRERLRALGWRVAELATVHDIDEPDDLRWLPAGWLLERGR